MATVTTKVHIAAPPALVRSIFLDFPSIPKWHTGHFSGITILDSAALDSQKVFTAYSPIGEALTVGDSLRISLGGWWSFKAHVKENTPSQFIWAGGLSSVMVGTHFFRFEESDFIPGGTMLTHGETFMGGLVTLCSPFLHKNDADNKSAGFEKFNADLKREAERRAAVAGQF